MDYLWDQLQMLASDSNLYLMEWPEYLLVDLYKILQRKYVCSYEISKKLFSKLTSPFITQTIIPPLIGKLACSFFFYIRAMKAIQARRTFNTWRKSLCLANIHIRYSYYVTYRLEKTSAHSTTVQFGRKRGHLRKVS